VTIRKALASPWSWVAVGALLRVLWPGDFLFRQDEAEHFAYALDVAARGGWPSHAWPSSAGVPNGPTFLWFLAAVARVTSDPRVATFAVAMTNVAALALSVPLFRSLLRGRGEATRAVALYATSPVAIWYSRKLWDPCVLAILAVPALWLTLRALERPGRRSVALVPVVLAAAALAHQSAAFFAVVLVAILLAGVRRTALLPLTIGLAFAGAIVTPYLRFLLTHAAHLAPGGRSAWPDIDVVTNLLLDVSGHNILQAAGREAGRMLLWPLPPLWLLVQLAAIPFYVYLFAGFAEAARPRARVLGESGGGEAGAPPRLTGGARWLLLGVGLGLPALFLVLRVNGVAHYFLTALPVLFALVVLGARRTAGFSRRARRWILPIPWLVAVNVTSWIGFQTYQANRHGSDSYGLPYAKIVQACSEVDAAAGEAGIPRGRALRLVVDVPRDRGPIPAQYRFVLERELGRPVEPPAAGEAPEITLRVRWPRPRGKPAWEVIPAAGRAAGSAS
jgi:4-amino-4-deoxy-L-arabinose transferase-like glycosyltransferase